MYQLSDCPACGWSELGCIFPSSNGDNSLARLVAKPSLMELPGFDLAANSVSSWHVCMHCSLLFARNRPSGDGVAQWYRSLFQYSEERNYNVAPLPAAYLKGKAAGAKTLMQKLEEHGVLRGANSIIHFRTGPGHLLAEARAANPNLEVFGLEYFKHPAEHARTLVGSDKVAEIDVPEPQHPFGQRKFDVVVANHFFTHAHDPRRLAGIFNESLTQDGRLVVYNELDHAMSLRSFSSYSRGLNFFHKQLWTRVTLMSFLQSQGFEVKDISTSHSGKVPKYMTLLCRKGVARPMTAGDPVSSRSLLRKWRWKHRVYRALKPVIDPVRKLVDQRAG